MYCNPLLGTAISFVVYRFLSPAAQSSLGNFVAFGAASCYTARLSPWGSWIS